MTRKKKLAIGAIMIWTPTTPQSLAAVPAAQRKWVHIEGFDGDDDVLVRSYHREWKGTLVAKLCELRPLGDDRARGNALLARRSMVESVRTKFRKLRAEIVEALPDDAFPDVGLYDTVRLTVSHSEALKIAEMLRAHRSIQDSAEGTP